MTESEGGMNHTSETPKADHTHDECEDTDLDFEPLPFEDVEENDEA